MTCLDLVLDKVGARCSKCIVSCGSQVTACAEEERLVRSVSAIYGNFQPQKHELSEAMQESDAFGKEDLLAGPAWRRAPSSLDRTETSSTQPVSLQPQTSQDEVIWIACAGVPGLSPRQLPALRSRHRACRCWWLGPQFSLEASRSDPCWTVSAIPYRSLHVCGSARTYQFNLVLSET